MTNATNKTVIVVVLAAGASSRFGTTKQLVEIDGIALVKRAVDVAIMSKASATVVVVGHDQEQVAAALMPFNGFLVCNENYSKGISSSLSQAVRATRHAADALIVMLADQPLITASHIDTLIDLWTGSADEIVATAFDDITGPPVLFASSCFDELALLQGDAGARALLGDDRFTLQTIAFADAAIDIDEPAGLSRLQHSARS